MPLDGTTIETHPDILEVDKAADVLRRYGWIQHDDGNIIEGFCLIGAAIHVAQRGPIFDRHPDITREILRRRGIQCGALAPASEFVPKYNDKKDMTRGNALRFLHAFRMELMKKLLVNGR